MPLSRPPFRALSAAVLLLGLTACASPGSEWVRSGADEATMAAERAECSRYAAASVAQDRAIDSDIAASRGGDWQRSGRSRSREQMLSRGTEQRRMAALQRCLVERGYVRG